MAFPACSKRMTSSGSISSTPRASIQAASDTVSASALRTLSRLKPCRAAPVGKDVRKEGALAAGSSRDPEADATELEEFHDMPQLCSCTPAAYPTKLLDEGRGARDTEPLETCDVQRDNSCSNR